jgi:hypothetical protein
MEFFMQPSTYIRDLPITKRRQLIHQLLAKTYKPDELKKYDFARAILRRTERVANMEIDGKKVFKVLKMGMECRKLGVCIQYVCATACVSEDLSRDCLKVSAPQDGDLVEYRMNDKWTHVGIYRGRDLEDNGRELVESKWGHLFAVFLHSLEDVKSDYGNQVIFYRKRTVINQSSWEKLGALIYSIFQSVINWIHQ